MELKKIEAKKGKLYVKAKYFAELGEGFHISSKQARMPVKGTMIYYSLINLVKAYLLVNGYDLETKTEHHGLSLPPNRKLDLKLSNINDIGVSIFHEFSKVNWS